MSIIEKSNVTGVFEGREQAERAFEALLQKGFSHEVLALVGQPEAVEKMFAQDRNPDNVEAAHSVADAEQPEHDIVVVSVAADERWQEALDILQTYGARDTSPTLQEREMAAREQALGIQIHGEHLEYEPVTGPHLVAEDGKPVATGSFGLKRDPALDQEPDQKTGEDIEKEERKDFFAPAGSAHDTRLRPRGVV